jgi:hypothetical protein
MKSARTVDNYSAGSLLDGGAERLPRWIPAFAGTSPAGMTVMLGALG